MLRQINPLQSSYLPENRDYYIENAAPFIATTFAIAVVGITCNLLTLWVWMGEKSHHATTFLFKYLAIFDILFLLFFPLTLDLYVTNEVFTKDLRNVNLPYHLCNFVQLVAVHTNLLMALARWIAVVRPFQVQRLLRRGRLRWSCVGIFLWCSALQITEVSASSDLHKSSYLWTKIGKTVVGLVLPIMATPYFCVSLVREYLRRARAATKTKDGRFSVAVVTPTHSSAGRISSSRLANSPAPDSRTQNPKRQTDHSAFDYRSIGDLRLSQEVRPSREVNLGCKVSIDCLHQSTHTSPSSFVIGSYNHLSRSRRLSLSVVIICAKSFLAYVVGFFVLVVVFAVCGFDTFLLQMAVVVTFLQMLNSSVNLFVYWGCVTRFQELFAVRLPCPPRTDSAVGPKPIPEINLPLRTSELLTTANAQSPVTGPKPRALPDAKTCPGPCAATVTWTSVGTSTENSSGPFDPFCRNNAKTSPDTASFAS